MLKKNYEKPNAEYIAFYSEQEIAAELPLELYANEDINAGISGGMGTGDIRPGVPNDD